MKKNKLILFDWGGIVEENYRWLQDYEKVFHDCGFDGKFELRDYKFSTIPNDEEFRKVFDRIKKDYNLNVDYEYFINKFVEVLDDTPYYKEVAEYEHSLKDKCYIGILSNLSIFDRDRIDKQVNLSMYDYVFLSYELTCRKPDREIYEKVQEKLPFDKKDILFIDDIARNTDMAKEFGWNVLNTTGKELDKIKKTCEEFLKD